MYLGMALRSKGGAALEAAIRKARGGIAVSEGAYVHNVCTCETFSCDQCYNDDFQGNNDSFKCVLVCDNHPWLILFY